MSKIAPIDINEYNYELPEERIAKYPLEQRDQSKLLVCLPQQDIAHQSFKDIDTILPEGHLVVYNNTKVIHARIEMKKDTGARIEVFCLSPVSPSDYQLMFSSKGECTWSCMIGNLKKWKSGRLKRALTIAGEELVLEAELLERGNNGSPIVKFFWNSRFTFSEVLEAVGKIPIPPYLNRDTEDIDSSRYQTVYSKHDGSVAAPTAGLHFTNEVFESLKRKSVEFAELTLHVGAGTFQPVKAENALNHQMHGEKIIIKPELLRKLIAYNGKIIATGTTSLRSLESIYWLGVKALLNKPLNCLEQWFWKENTSTPVSMEDSFTALLDYMKKEKVDFIVSTTEIMIVPGYKFRVIKGIITNFHQPKSTLLLLISALIGERWKEVYDYALKNDFRFLSYGDSSLLFKV